MRELYTKVKLGPCCSAQGAAAGADGSALAKGPGSDVGDRRAVLHRGMAPVSALPLTRRVALGNFMPPCSQSRHGDNDHAPSPRGCQGTVTRVSRAHHKDWRTPGTSWPFIYIYIYLGKRQELTKERSSWVFFFLWRQFTGLPQGCLFS